MSKIMTLQGPNLHAAPQMPVQLLGHLGATHQVELLGRPTGMNGPGLAAGRNVQLLGPNNSQVQLLGPFGDTVPVAPTATPSFFEQNQTLLMLAAAGVVGYHFYKKSKTGKGLFGAKKRRR